MRLTRMGGLAATLVGTTSFILSAHALSISVPVAGGIQAALDTASPGDTVVVGPGHYLENLWLPDRVGLQGAGPGLTVIRGRSRWDHPVLFGAGGSGCSIRGLTIAEGGVGLYLADAPDVTVSDCAFSANGIGVMALKCSRMSLVRCSFSGSGTAIFFDGPAPAVEVSDCALRGNGQGIHCLDGAAPLIVSCNLSRNTTALSSVEGASPLVLNCLLAGNTFGLRGDMGSTPSLTNCTVWLSTYAVRCDRLSSVRVSNSIIWGGPALVDVLSGSVAITNSDVQGGYPGQGNIDHDPLFRQANLEDLRLLPGSPCIDAGDNSVPGLPRSDMAGMHRIMYGGKNLSVDMGAYEYYINDVNLGPGASETTLTWSSLGDKTYSIFYTRDLLTWHLAEASVPSVGNRTTSWTDDGTLTGIPPSLGRRRFYRILENP